MQVPSTPELPAPTTIQVPQAPPPPGAGYFFRIPRSRREIDALRNQREEMSSQLISARNRRGQLAREYERSSGANRAGLEQQLGVLDQRIVRLETDIAESGRMLTSLDVGLLQTSTSMPGSLPFGLGSAQVTGISVVFTLFVLAPVALATARSIWRRASKPVLPAGWSDSAQRLERLEQAVDAVAIEMERVSEGQRFMTRIMTQRSAAPDASAAGSPEPARALHGEGQPLPALGGGSPEQPFVPLSEQEAVRVRRG